MNSKVLEVLLGMAVAILVLSPSSLHADNRSIDGVGNNVSNPQWGSVNANFVRLDSVHYADMISAPSGTTRPNARDVSNMVGVQAGPMMDSAARSDFVWQWGQFLDHDITKTAGGNNEFLGINVNDPMDPLHPMIPMMRSGFDPATGTGTNNPRQQFNEITAFIDASMVYGSDTTRANALREMSGGRLATSAGGQLMPKNTGLLPNANDGVEPDETLFLGGDVRANEQLGLISIHTLFVREHNRLAGEIATANPGWTDEQIYQRARKVVGGIVQNITYKEYLPALIGTSAPNVLVAAYDPNVNPTLSNEFSTAAYRLGHTQVSPLLTRVDTNGNPAAGGDVALMDAFFVPSFFADPMEVDYLLHGLATQIQQATDVHIIDDLRNAMFGAPGSGGLDLMSLNIQRGRDHGLGTITELQAALGMTPASSFAELTSDPTLQAELAAVYASVEDIDLWVGMLVEDTMPGSALGATMTKVVADQFESLMVGDRFFYMWDDDLSADDLAMIMDTQLSDVILRNTGILQLQSNVFFVPEPSMFSLFTLGLIAATFLRRRA